MADKDKTQDNQMKIPEPESKDVLALKAEMAKMKAEMEKALNDAQKTAADIIEEANKIKEQALQTKATEVVSNTQPQPEKVEMVSIKLFKDGDRYKDDLTVALNGVTYTIQRGKVVMVPKGVAEIIDASTKQDIDAALFREARADEYAKSL